MDLILGGDEDDYSMYLDEETIPTLAQGQEASEYVTTIGFVDPTGSAWNAIVRYGDGNTETLSGFARESGLPLSQSMETTVFTRFSSRLPTMTDVR